MNSTIYISQRSLQYASVGKILNPELPLIHLPMFQTDRKIKLYFGSHYYSRQKRGTTLHPLYCVLITDSNQSLGYESLRSWKGELLLYSALAVCLCLFMPTQWPFHLLTSFHFVTNF